MKEGLTLIRKLRPESIERGIPSIRKQLLSFGYTYSFEWGYTYLLFGHQIVCHWEGDRLIDYCKTHARRASEEAIIAYILSDFIPSIENERQ